ncbi:MAG TPA: cysteine desulfurase CsdA [Bacteroidetes bacterium]|nr:cysteine desulfurase CsdA [Bacteroidota bacterium]
MSQLETQISFDVTTLRKDFPILSTTVYGKPLVYLDNAATTQKPNAVLDIQNIYYREQNSNIHRGVHHLSEVATFEYEKARGKVKNFINAADNKEVIFTKGTTDSINLVAQSFGKTFLNAGDEVIISTMEHHSNIVPWQMICEEQNANLRIIPMNDDGELVIEEFEKLLSPKTKIVSVVYISNSIGTINPIKQIIELAHRNGSTVLIDGAQAVAHIPVDVRALDCDFFAFSGHKIFGPTGIGVLYGKAALLDQMKPYQGGGDMIRSVTFEKTTYNDLPYKFEAGTPNIVGGIGLGAAIDYVNIIGLNAISRYEHELLEYGTEILSHVSGLRLIGTAKSKASILSFVLDNAHPHDIGTILDREGIAIRTGHHCTQPVMKRFGIPATARASISFYNTKEELDALVRGIAKVSEIFG